MVAVSFVALLLIEPSAEAYLHFREPREIVPPDAIELKPSPAYKRLFKATEECTGRRGKSPRYYVIDSLGEGEVDGEPWVVLGVYLTDPHAVVLVASELFAWRTIIHEDLHALGFFQRGRRVYPLLGTAATDATPRAKINLTRPRLSTTSATHIRFLRKHSVMWWSIPPYLPRGRGGPRRNRPLVRHWGICFLLQSSRPDSSMPADETAQSTTPLLYRKRSCNGSYSPAFLPLPDTQTTSSVAAS